MHRIESREKNGQVLVLSSRSIIIRLITSDFWHMRAP